MVGSGSFATMYDVPSVADTGMSVKGPVITAVSDTATLPVGSGTIPFTV